MNTIQRTATPFSSSENSRSGTTRGTSPSVCRVVAPAFAAAAAIVASGCAHTGSSGGWLGSAHSGGSTPLLAEYLTGSFSSAAQAERDPENFFDIRLHAVEIWTDRDDGPWLYVEQAAASAMDRPYRQRVYRLRSPQRGVFVSDVYTMPQPMSRAGWWATPERFDGAFTPADLVLREGCSITMRAATNRGGPTVFYGATNAVDCESSLRGATYATSEVELFPDRLETWDRGYDADGTQVWGATEAGYIFDRVD